MEVLVGFGLAICYALAIGAAFSLCVTIINLTNKGDEDGNS